MDKALLVLDIFKRILLVTKRECKSKASNEPNVGKSEYDYKLKFSSDGIPVVYIGNEFGPVIYGMANFFRKNAAIKRE